MYKKNLLVGLVNFLTYMNYVCGMLAVLLYPSLGLFSSWFFLLALMFDYIDGFAARKLSLTSKLGYYLDALSDSISFWAMVAIYIILTAYSQHLSYTPFLVCIWLVYVWCVVYRLARFLTISEDSIHTKNSYYKGMPVTVNGIILPIIITISSFLSPTQEVILFILFFLTSWYLMISSIRFRKI